MNAILNKELLVFSKKFDEVYEAKAANSRGDFIQRFPVGKLKYLTLDNYVIGKGAPSFCALVEAKTKAWANMQGATSFKFGIYFGKTKSDPEKKFRFTKKFGEVEAEAFKNVKEALLNLIEAGKALDFNAIDKNPLSQMFKAKILSLYFPDNYLNICSSDHLQQLSLEIFGKEQKFFSECQHLLVLMKQENKVANEWSNPKFMSFLYNKYIRKELDINNPDKIKKPREKIRKKVNFEDISANRDAIGKTSEEFAIVWEKNRLIGLGYPDLAGKIEDRRDIPSYGYDYLSYTSPNVERYIEVKSVGRDKKEGCYRFFLSENELSVSNSGEHINEYYFYLVLYGKDGMPSDILVKKASDFYRNSEVIPCSYVVRFEIEDY